jgi:hypothetical protein
LQSANTTLGAKTKRERGPEPAPFLVTAVCRQPLSSFDGGVRPAWAYPRLDRIRLADKTVMRDSWYVIFSLLSLAIGLALLLFVTFAQ